MEFYKREALQFIMAHPGQFLANTYNKAVMFWRAIKPGTVPLKVTPIPALSWLDQIVQSTDQWLLILLLPGLGISLFWGFRRNHILLWLILYYTLVTSLGIIVHDGRYRLPIMPLVAVYASLVLYSATYIVSRVIQSVAQGFKRGGVA